MRRTSPPAPVALAVTLIPLLLGSCNRTTDTFKPRITINSESGGSGVSRQNKLTVNGFALDDTGVTGVTVDGKPLTLLPGTRKLAHFRFEADMRGGKGTYTIVARDAAGNKDTLVLPITVDGEAPTITVTRFERSGNVVRVSGVAQDNNSVSEVTVDGNRLNITPGRRVEFYAETTGIYADLQVTDAAGNVTKKRAQ